MSKKLLLVTNSLLTSETLGVPCRLANYDVAVVRDARQALGGSAHQHPDVLVLDLDGASDNDADARHLMSHILESDPGVPVILITWRSDLCEEAATLGIRVLAEKPIDVPALLRTADELVREPRPGAADCRARRTRHLQHLPSNADAFCEALQQRAVTPYASATPDRHWGLNE